MSESVAAVGPRQPCPCGSGRRYKACHGSDRAARMITARPFAGLVDEPDLVALREVVPSASAPLPLKDATARPVVLVTVLPQTLPAVTGTDGTAYVAMQTPGRSGDVSRDLGQAVVAAQQAEPGTVFNGLDRDDAAPRLQDLLTDAPLDITVHADLPFWAAVPDPDGSVANAMERASTSLSPTVRLTSVQAAYWCRIGSRCHVRWALTYDEDAALDALARLHTAGALGLGEGTRYVGSFRAHGLLVPVWDLPVDSEAEQAEAPAAAVAARLAEEIAAPRALTAEERRARNGLLSRQVTLR